MTSLSIQPQTDSTATVLTHDATFIFHHLHTSPHNTVPTHNPNTTPIHHHIHSSAARSFTHNTIPIHHHINPSTTRPITYNTVINYLITHTQHANSYTLPHAQS
jgi:hypothetical protein